MAFSRQEFWSGLPCPPPGDLPHPGITPVSPSLLQWQVGSLPLAPPRAGDPKLLSLRAREATTVKSPHSAASSLCSPQLEEVWAAAKTQHSQSLANFLEKNWARDMHQEVLRE